jgi:hypothetical protein
MSKSKEIKIKDLKEDDFFKLQKTQRIFRVFKKLIKLGDDVPAQFKGKSLIILNNCKQITVNEDDVCYLKTDF